VSRRRVSPPTGIPTFDRRQLLRIFGAVGAVAATGGLVACGDELPTGAVEPPSGLTIPIGFISPNAGPYTRVGSELLNGFTTYLEGTSGLLGRHTVDLRVVDEGETAESAVAAAQGLLEQGVVAIAGVANPAALPPLASAVQEKKVPLVSSNGAPKSLTNALFVWRVSYVEGEPGQALAQYARTEGGRVALFYEDSATGRAEVDAFRTAFIDLGGQIVADQPGSANLGSRISAARVAGANSLFVAFSGADATAMLEAYRASGMTAKLLGTGALTETIDLTTINPLPSRVYTSLYYAADLDNEANRRFVAAYHQANGVQPSGYAMSGYDSAAVLDKALRLVDGSPTGATLNQAFSLLGQIDSPRGSWTFNINRTPQQKWYLRRLHLDGMVPANLLDTDLTVLG
jgi:branched-chain amino acid transport system substrate-binding protein